MKEELKYLRWRKIDETPTFEEQQQVSFVAACFKGNRMLYVDDYIWYDGKLMSNRIVRNPIIPPPTHYMTLEDYLSIPCLIPRD